ncbi:MAG TPA: hydroxymethylglutaryl-CoA lyase [Chloroflexia bacterium]|nr:hydroxymethylglutaryl-CoA lyase [Chloroflexia bacterium]
MPERVTVYEVGPRDGLQNEGVSVPTEAKIAYINMLSEAGFRFIEATSFVSPRAVPQLGDAGEVMSRITRRSGTRYPVLVPNERGMQRALEAGVTDVAVFTAASESFTKANINSTIRESIENFEPVVRLARAEGIEVRGYVSTAFGCPYDGYVAPQRVREVVAMLTGIGIGEVSLGDTIGVATPRDTVDVLTEVLREVEVGRLAVHFHDTRGTALANVLTSLEMGVSTVDTSSAGLGGCPYAPGAAGNLATEDLLYMLDGMGIETGVDMQKVREASLFILGVLGKAPPSKYLQAFLGDKREVATAHSHA